MEAVSTNGRSFQFLSKILASILTHFVHWWTKWTSVVYTSGAAAIRARPVFDACLVALAAGIVSGTSATCAVDGPGAGAAVAVNGAFSATSPAVFISSAALGADIFPCATANRASDAFPAIAEGAVSPSAAATERAIVRNSTPAGASAAFTVGRNHTGKQCQSRQKQNDR